MHKRIVGIYVLILSMVTVLFLRLAALSQGGEFQSVARNQSSYGVRIGETRGMIYDRNLKPLVNRDQYIALSVIPIPEAVATLQNALPREQFDNLLPTLESGKPVQINTRSPISGVGITSFEMPVRYTENQTAVHVIGYLNGENKGVTGIEAGYNSYLEQTGGSIRVRYNVSAWGTALGDEPQSIEDTRPQNNGGLVLTLDRDIQKITESAMSVIEKGAAVVMDVNTGEIVSLVSMPTYSPLQLQKALDDPDSPFFNRAISAYNVGSTFKIVVAAAALEQGITPDFSYVCNGAYTLNDVKFHCHLRTGHWELSMERAVAQSCNPYFINLGQTIGAKSIITMARSMGFGSSATLADGISSAAGNLPELDKMTTGELANLSFGQGKLTATPVQIAQMISSVANGGIAVVPSIYKGISPDGSIVPIMQETEVNRVMSQNTAKTLQKLLVNVIDKGSGHNARTQYASSGGKTGTAQTGVWKDQEEILHGWFAGFYPATKPQYAIVILEEGGGNGGDKPASIFKKICDDVSLLENPMLERQVGAK